MIDYAALKAILPCLNHVRTVRLNGARLEAEAINRLADIAAEVRKKSLQVNYDTYFSRLGVKSVGKGHWVVN